MGDTDPGPKLGIEQSPLEKILEHLELAKEHDSRTTYNNPHGLACPCCDKRFHRAIVSDAAWSTVGAPKPLEVCIGTTPNGRVIFAHLLESDD